tara:strand:- start:199 stop:456 length:258 start_codon:yes stop_codon:yes gene_type:complete
MAVFKQAWALLLKTWRRRVRIRHLALACTTVPAAPVQASLFPDPADCQIRSDRLVSAMDRIRDRFGIKALQTGAALGTAADAPSR